MRLGVNIDHVATIRQQRFTKYPDPVMAALLAEEGGADQITLHLREDRRHIQERDLFRLRETVGILINLEMAATDEMIKIAKEFKPDIVCLVPERREELTTEGGLDLKNRFPKLREQICSLKEADIPVSLFINPDTSDVDLSRELKSHAVELHTGAYADAKTQAIRDMEYQRLGEAAARAASLGLRVHAGHGLEYNNVKPIAVIPEIEELNIGHSIIARAIFTGLKEAVRDMIAVIRAARGDS